MFTYKNQYISLIEGSSIPIPSADFAEILKTSDIRLEENCWKWIWNKANGVIIQPGKVKTSPAGVPRVNSGQRKRIETKTISNAIKITLAFISLMGGYFFLLIPRWKKGMYEQPLSLSDILGESLWLRSWKNPDAQAAPYGKKRRRNQNLCWEDSGAGTLPGVPDGKLTRNTWRNRKANKRNLNPNRPDHVWSFIFNPMI